MFEVGPRSDGNIADPTDVDTDVLCDGLLNAYMDKDNDGVMTDPADLLRELLEPTPGEDEAATVRFMELRQQYAEHLATACGLIEAPNGV